LTSIGFIFAICSVGSKLKNIKNLIVSQVAHQTVKQKNSESEVLQLKFHEIDLKISPLEMIDIDMELFVEVCGLIDYSVGCHRVQVSRVKCQGSRVKGQMSLTVKELLHFSDGHVLYWQRSSVHSVRLLNFDLLLSLQSINQLNVNLLVFTDS
jgi:hypothetical protein